MAIEVPAVDKDSVIAELSDKLEKATLEATEYRVLATQLLGKANELNDRIEALGKDDESVVEGEVVTP